MVKKPNSGSKCTRSIQQKAISSELNAIKLQRLQYDTPTGPSDVDKENQALQEAFMPEDRIFIRKQARIINSLGLEQQHREEQAEYQAHMVQEKQEKDLIQEAKKQATQCLTLTVAELDKQYNWHWRRNPSLPPKSHFPTKKENIEALKNAIIDNLSNLSIQMDGEVAEEELADEEAEDSDIEDP
ncbi:hypothetical protein M422DRAFT_247289 [Sphaerobolus stellatus SS14]|nr:hypothetical protein M422DRAFT_247289 [Sphaerobolus stellatus SS14]